MTQTSDTTMEPEELGPFTRFRPSLVVQEDRRHKLRRNQAVLFTDPTRVWMIEKGSIVVQSSRFGDGRPIGPRRHLFDLFGGNAIFGFDPAAAGVEHGWLGIAASDAVIWEMELQHFSSAVVQGSAGERKLLGLWVGLLGKRLSEGLAPPKSLLRIPESGDWEFGEQEGIAIAPDIFLWLKVKSGTLMLLGHPEFRLAREDQLFLAGGDLWFKVHSPVCELATLTPNQSDDVGSGLTQLQTVFARHLDRLRFEEEAAEVERRKSSYTLRQLETEAELQNLGQVLDPVERFPPRDTPLLTAASVLGSEAGITIHPPQAAEDLNRVNDPVEAIARASKVRHRKILLGPQWSKSDLGPFLGFLGEERHPVALLPDSSGYSIVHPARRFREPLTPELEEQISQEAYMLYRPLPDQQRNIGDLLRFTFRGKSRDLAFIVLMAFSVTILGMVTPRVTGTLVDTAIPAADVSFLWQLAGILFVAGLATGTLTYTQLMTMVRTSIRTEESAQSALWDRLLRASPRFFRSFASGELQHRVNAVGEISRELNTATLRPLFSGVMAILNWLLLWYYSWELARMAILIGLVVLAVVMLIGGRVRRLSKLLYDAEGKYQGLVIQLIGGVSKIRVAGSERRAFNQWLRFYTNNLKLILQIQAWKDAMTLINSVLVPVSTAFLFWLAIDLTLELPLGDPDRISIGDFVAFNSAFILYLVGWTDLSNALVEVMDSAAKLYRIRPLLEEKPEVSDDASDPRRLTGRIKFDDVSFRYAEDGPLIIDRMSFEVRPGEYIAFVGPSGSGKSTILRLLLGFETPTDGRVLYDGKDLAALDVLAVRRQIGTVLQEGRLNAASILENISNNSKVTLAEVWDAIADAGMSADIEQMPMGLHTMISEGGWNISGGQRQRLLIARAMVLRPRVFMFDEATSALDNNTQAIVGEALDRRKCARIVIAHRLSTIRHANRILVLDKGRIVQEGTFEELSGQEGLFKDLMRRQML